MDGCLKLDAHLADASRGGWVSWSNRPTRAIAQGLPYQPVVKLLSCRVGESWFQLGCGNAAESVDSGRLARASRGHEAPILCGMSFATGCYCRDARPHIWA